MAQKMPPGQRALFTFLIATLVAPALAALAVLAAAFGAALLGRAGPPPGSGTTALAWSAGLGLTTYVASALPAGVFGAAMAALVWRNGGFSWLAAAIAGAVAATCFAAFSSAVSGPLTPYAFLGAMVAVAIWALTERLRLHGRQHSARK